MGNNRPEFDKLYIWGPNLLNNRLLSRHVQGVTGIPPICIGEADEIKESYLTPQSLFLCDCDKIEPKSYCRKIQRTGFTLKESPAIVLLNISRTQDILEEINTYAIHGIFFISDQFEMLEKGIRKVLDGEMWLSRELLSKSLHRARESSNKNVQLSLGSDLTSREREILRLVALGLSNQAIAERLFISTNTVKTHIGNIYKKIDAINRVQAIIWANEYLVMHDYCPDSLLSAQMSHKE